MFEHDTVDRDRRALLGAAGALILQAALQPTTASGQTASGPKMKIGIIGAGHIGGTIGELWAKAGHPVFFSSRHPEELKQLVERLGPLAQAGTVDQAIAWRPRIIAGLTAPCRRSGRIANNCGQDCARRRQCRR
jgi:lactate dehydrogenase-like 2-hydroxyacid dehydrogenase